MLLTFILIKKWKFFHGITVNIVCLFYLKLCTSTKFKYKTLSRFMDIRILQLNKFVKKVSKCKISAQYLKILQNASKIVALQSFLNLSFYTLEKNHYWKFRVYDIFFFLNSKTTLCSSIKRHVSYCLGQRKKYYNWKCKNTLTILL